MRDIRNKKKSAEFWRMKFILRVLHYMNQKIIGRNGFVIKSEDLRISVGVLLGVFFLYEIITTIKIK